MGDPADVFRFGWGGGEFAAVTLSTTDLMLFLFDGNGAKLASVTVLYPLQTRARTTCMWPTSRQASISWGSIIIRSTLTEISAAFPLARMDLVVIKFQ